MAIRTAQLEAPARIHLHSLITSRSYRDDHSHASYDFGPAVDGGMGRQRRDGESIVKWGYEHNLAAGTAQRVPGDRDPGANRFCRVIVKNTHAWYKLVHAPGNTYRFHFLTFPRCGACQGTTTHLCPACRGLGRQQAPEFDRGIVRLAARGVRHMPAAVRSQCTACAGQGHIKCACAPGTIINGYSISTNLRDWS